MRLVHLNTPVIFGEEWDREDEIEDYALAMSPLLQMSEKQTQARLSEFEAQMARGEYPVRPIATERWIPSPTREYPSAKN